jgi:hypothetical protein
MRRLESRKGCVHMHWHYRSFPIILDSLIALSIFSHTPDVPIARRSPSSLRSTAPRPLRFGYQPLRDLRNPIPKVHQSLSNLI